MLISAPSKETVRGSQVEQSRTLINAVAPWLVMPPITIHQGSGLHVHKPAHTHTHSETHSGRVTDTQRIL